MPNMKLNADELEQELRDYAQRAIERVANVTESMVRDVRTVADAQSQLAGVSGADLVTAARVAMVQDVDLRTKGTLRELELGARFNCEYDANAGGQMSSGRLSVPSGRYRLLVFLVDAPATQNATTPADVIDLNDADDPLRGEDQDRDGDDEDRDE